MVANAGRLAEPSNSRTKVVDFTLLRNHINPILRTLNEPACVDSSNVTSSWSEDSSYDEQGPPNESVLKAEICSLQLFVYGAVSFPKKVHISYCRSVSQLVDKKLCAGKGFFCYGGQCRMISSA